MHTIYHIPGQKVGCTNNYARRKKQYPPGTEFEVLVEADFWTAQQAGDIEFLFADIFGYPRGQHYIYRWKNNSEHSRALSTKRNEEYWTPEKRERWRQELQNRPLNIPSEAIIASNIRRTGLTRTAEASWQCPHCGKIGVGGCNRTRWHFDNCKERP